MSSRRMQQDSRVRSGDWVTLVGALLAAVPLLVLVDGVWLWLLRG